MKRISSVTINIAITAGMLATGMAQQARAADGCTKATLKGSYGAQLTGTIPGVGPFVAVAVANFDGSGGWSYTETGNANGNTFSQHFVGTYTVASNCSGTTIDSAGNSTALVIVSGGKEVMAISTGGAVLSIVLKKISSSND